MNSLVNFIVSVTKCLMKAVEGRKASSGSQFEGAVRRGRKSCSGAVRQQVLSHPVRKQRVTNACAQLSLIHSWTPARGDGAAHIQGGSSHLSLI